MSATSIKRSGKIFVTLVDDSEQEFVVESEYDADYTEQELIANTEEAYAGIVRRAFGDSLKRWFWQWEKSSAEVHQRCSKAVRFGIDEIQVGQSFTNAERIAKEYADLIGVYELLQEEFGLPHPLLEDVEEKKAKVARWLDYSAKCGTVTL